MLGFFSILAVQNVPVPYETIPSSEFVVVFCDSIIGV